MHSLLIMGYAIFMKDTLTVFNERKPAYDIYIRENYKDLLGGLDSLNIKNRRIMIVTDTNVGPLYLKEARKIFSQYSSHIYDFVMEAGEVNKNLATVKSCYEKLIQEKFDRNDLLIALGGGVVGDLTGFVAATYLRGVKFIQMPTSLLSMVDSSIGGKTGVDFNSYKNMVGAFYQPILVYINIETLTTLADPEFYSGMSEIIKHGLIKDLDYYKWLKTNRDLIVEKDTTSLKEMILRSCEIKKEVVEEDPKEKGIRALLNFGHTIGHAIEKFMNFSLLHGECVSLGMVAASHISHKRGYIDEKDHQDIVDVLKSFYQPTLIETLNLEEIIETSKSDKKMDLNKIKFILLEEIGRAIIDTNVNDDEMRESIKYISAGKAK